MLHSDILEFAWKVLDIQPPPIAIFESRLEDTRLCKSQSCQHIAGLEAEACRRDEGNDGKVGMYVASTCFVPTIAM